MAARLVEILVPANRATDLRRILTELEVETLTDEALAEGRFRLRLLLEAEQSGGVVDRVQQALGAEGQFHLIMLPVEAALPRSEPPPAPEPGRRAAAIGSRGISREELYSDIGDMARLSGVFVATVFLSSVVAAVGMLRDSVAVIVGAMVIAPLLGPNVSLAFGTTLGDTSLIRRSLSCNLVGMLFACGLAVVVGLIIDVDPALRSLESRTVVQLSDVVLALAAGSAGTLALTTGLPSALVGVMVAVALLPPTVAMGLMLGDGHWSQAAGAAQLLLVNVICVNLAGVVTFLVQGVRPLSWWEAVRARKATRLAIAIWIALLAALVAVMLLAEKRMAAP